MRKSPELGSSGNGEQKSRTLSDIGFLEGIRFGLISKRAQRLRPGRFRSNIVSIAPSGDLNDGLIDPKGKPVDLRVSKGGTGLDLMVEKTSTSKDSPDGALVRTEVNITYDEMYGDAVTPYVSARRTTFLPMDEGDPEVLDVLEYSASRINADNSLGLHQIAATVREAVRIQEDTHTFAHLV